MGKNETTLVDENNVLGNFAVSYPGVDFSVSGNELHVSTSETEFRYHYRRKAAASPLFPAWSQAARNTGCGTNTRTWSPSMWEGSAEPVKCCFSLEIKAGALQLVKTSEDGKVEGIPFHISGNGVEKDVVTGPDGTIKVDNLQAGNYTVTEKAPDKYVQPASQQVTIYPGQTSSVSFSNILKKFTVEMEKKDSGHNKPRSTEYEAQGDATLDGAVYGLFKGETLLDTYTTANGGKFTTKEYPCGPDYSIREISPSEGYLLDETVYPVGAGTGQFHLGEQQHPHDCHRGRHSRQHRHHQAYGSACHPGTGRTGPAVGSARLQFFGNPGIHPLCRKMKCFLQPAGSKRGIRKPRQSLPGEPSSESSPAPESEPEPAPSASIVPQLVPAVASLASKASVLPFVHHVLQR